MSDETEQAEAGGRNFKFLALFGALLMLFPLILYWQGGEESQEQSDSVSPVKVVEKSAPLHSDEQINSIFEKHIEALGGLSAIRKVNTLITEGTMSDGKELSSFYTIKKRPGLEAVTINSDAFVYKRWFNGESGWMETSVEGQVRARRQVEGEEIAMLRTMTVYDDPVVRYVLSDAYDESNAETVVELKEEGASYEDWVGDWLTIIFPNAVEYHIFIDNEKSLIRYSKIVANMDVLILSFGTYQAFDNLLYPQNYTVYSEKMDSTTFYEIGQYRSGGSVFKAVFEPSFAQDEK